MITGNLETTEKEENKYKTLYILRELFDNCLFDVEVLANYLFSEVVENNPEAMGALREINRRMREIFCSSNIDYELEYRTPQKKNLLYSLDTLQKNLDSLQVNLDITVQKAQKQKTKKQQEQ